ESLWPNNFVQTALACPLVGSIKQSLCHLQIFNRLKEIELSLLGAMILVIGAIFHHSNTPHNFPIALGHKEIRIRVLIKRMLVAVKHEPNIAQNWRYPLWAIFVDLKGKAHKCLNLSLVRRIQQFNLDRHKTSLGYKG